jgi:hypothetical protein
MVPSNQADNSAFSLQFIDSDGAIGNAFNIIANSAGRQTLIPMFLFSDRDTDG